jgi:membrane protein DedA with SNARE-associated domain
MGFLSGFHGVVALVLLCSLLFAEEAGVPLPFAPGELTLVVAGLLVAAGGLDLFIFIPCAFVSCVAGSALGYSWARLVGEKGLETLAARLHQGSALERISKRIRAAGPVRIGVTRLIPGLRIYTTLVAGAVGVSRRTFFAGMVPVTAIWVTVFVLLGALVGVPVEHFFDQVEKLGLQGGILVAIGVGGYVAIRRAPSTAGSPLMHLSGPVRVGLAVAVDAAVVASIVAGLLSLVRLVTGAGVKAGWADGVVVIAAISVLYLLLLRRGAGSTVGEALLRTSYRHRIRPHIGRPRPTVTSDPGQLSVMARRMGILASAPRLLVAQALLERWTTTEELERTTHLTPEEVLYHLSVLEEAELVDRRGSPEPVSYRVREASVPWLATVISGVVPQSADS